DDHPADGYPIGASLDKLLPELVGRPLSKRPFFACGWAVQQGTVFRHDTVKNIDAREDFDQIVQIPPRNGDEFAAGFTDLLERQDRVLAAFSVPCKSAVIVASQGVVSHNFSLIMRQTPHSR